MQRFVVVMVVVAFVATAIGCGNQLTIPKDKAAFAKGEIEKIAREYAPIADEAFADESIELRLKRAELRTRLYTILELIAQDVQENDRRGLVDALLRATLFLMGVPQ